MSSLTFNEEFAGAVESGAKTQTIRRVRETPIKVGDTLQLYTGHHVLPCRQQIGVGVVREISAVRLSADGVDAYVTPLWQLMRMPPEQSEDVTEGEFAKADGFKDWPEMRDWFERQYGLPFEGVLIRWELKEVSDE